MSSIGLIEKLLEDDRLIDAVNVCIFAWWVNPEDLRRIVDACMSAKKNNTSSPVLNFTRCTIKIENLHSERSSCVRNSLETKGTDVRKKARQSSNSFTKSSSCARLWTIVEFGRLRWRISEPGRSPCTRSLLDRCSIAKTLR